MALDKSLHLSASLFPSVRFEACSRLSGEIYRIFSTAVIIGVKCKRAAFDITLLVVSQMITSNEIPGIYKIPNTTPVVYSC